MQRVLTLKSFYKSFHFYGIMLLENVLRQSVIVIIAAF